MPNAGIPVRLPLPEADEVHVWTVGVSESLPQLAAFDRLLAAEERQRAARFVRPADRASYLVAHGILRQLLGGYLQATPAGLSFVANAFGKPALAPGTGLPPLAFNLAHSGEMIVFAVTAGRQVGVDIECIRTDLEVMTLAHGQFSPQEIGTLQTLAPADRTAAFFRCWTRKEAYVKARGEGLGLPLSQFSVAFGPVEPPEIRWAADDPAASTRWSVWDLGDMPGYAGAVVAEGRPLRLVSRRWVAAAARAEV